MRLLFAMTSETVMRSFRALLAFDMTPFTIRQLVFASQCKVGCRVVKQQRVQRRNGKVPTLVFGVTAGTVGDSHQLATPVESLFFINILANDLVALKAQAILRLTIKCLVAILAIVLKLGVRG